MLDGRTDTINKKHHVCVTLCNGKKIPILRLLCNIVSKIAVSEGAVERAFSRHRLFHSRLRANLKAESMDSQSFVRYNFETILNVAKLNSVEVEVEEEMAKFHDVNF